MKEINKTAILQLYKKYEKDLKRIRKEQQKILKEKGPSRYESFLIYRATRKLLRTLHLKTANKFMNINPQMDDIEAEITYLLIREQQPETIVEIAPCGGWSTTWILQALKDNNKGRLYSYDIVDDSTKIVPQKLAEGRWAFTKGDIKQHLHLLPKNIDYLFLDAEHTASFATWYTNNLLPLIPKGSIICVHDVYHTTDPNGKYDEGGIIINWLKKEKNEYFTASKTKEPNNYKEIETQRTKQQLTNMIPTTANSMIYFIKQDETR